MNTELEAEKAGDQGRSCLDSLAYVTTNVDTELEAETVRGQEALCLDSLTYVTASYGRDFPAQCSFQGHGLLNGWPDAPFQDFDHDSYHNGSLHNDPETFKNIESPILSTFNEWDPAFYLNTNELNEPNDPTDTTDLFTLFPFPQDFTSDISSQSWPYPMESILVFDESSGSSSSAAQSTETEMTPFAPCSPDLSPPMEETLASQRRDQTEAMTKKQKRNRPCDLRREMKKVERPAKCPVAGCEYPGAAEIRGLERHLIAKHKDTAISRGLSVGKIKCKYFPSCDTTFSRKDHLRRHLRNKHGGG